MSRCHSHPHRLIICALALCVMAKAARCGEAAAQAETRDPTWAVPMPDTPGLPNLHKITDDLYRGAQPSDEGMAQLKAMGIKTVINLRWLHSDEDEIGDLGLSLVNIPMRAWDRDLDEDAVKFLRVVTDPERQPVFFHCRHGADRTGTMCAVYRMAVQGWSADRAVEEMREGGYNFHSIWSNLPKYLKHLDIVALREQAGLDADGKRIAEKTAK